jgi:hypothetical protein
MYFSSVSVWRALHIAVYGLQSDAVLCKFRRKMAEMVAGRQKKKDPSDLCLRHIGNDLIILPVFFRDVPPDILELPAFFYRGW